MSNNGQKSSLVQQLHLSASSLPNEKPCLNDLRRFTEGQAGGVGVPEQEEGVEAVVVKVVLASTESDPVEVKSPKVLLKLLLVIALPADRITGDTLP